MTKIAAKPTSLAASAVATSSVLVPHHRNTKKRSWSSSAKTNNNNSNSNRTPLHRHKNVNHQQQQQKQQQQYLHKPPAPLRLRESFVVKQAGAEKYHGAKKAPPPVLAAPQQQQQQQPCRQKTILTGHHHHHHPLQKQYQQYQQQTTTTTTDMRTILQRYHRLATTHYRATKKRRLDSQLRAAQNSKRIEQIRTLHKMAKDTLDFCEGILRSEQGFIMRSSSREVEEEEMMEQSREEEEDGELKRAEREKTLAENFLRQYGNGDGDEGSNNANNDGRMMMNDENAIIEQHKEEEEHTIGGIPSRFLDLSHFPQFKKKLFRSGGDKKKKNNIFSPDAADYGDDGDGDGEGKKKSRAIIDCTEESPRRRRLDFLDRKMGGKDSVPMRIPSFGCSGFGSSYNTPQQQQQQQAGIPEQGIPQEICASAVGACGENKKAQKQNTKRIYISRASLSHVNGTYVQEGNYNDAPLFVRVGPPRKFMGKWDCSVVLRRERCYESSDYDMTTKRVGKKQPPVAKGGDEKNEKYRNNGKEATYWKEQRYVWKIGLVPTHRITHPRIIGYFVATERDETKRRIVPPKRVSANIDCMDEDFDDDDDDYKTLEACSLEPPVEGWKVFQQQQQEGVGSSGGVGVSAGTNVVGRASGLKVSYEE